MRSQVHSHWRLTKLDLNYTYFKNRRSLILVWCSMLDLSLLVAVTDNELSSNQADPTIAFLFGSVILPKVIQSMKLIVKLFVHTIIIIVLTIVTQIGGLVWMIVMLSNLLFRKKPSRITRVVSFLVLYLLISFLMVPPLAKMNDRVPLPTSKSGKVIPHAYFTILLNRHYVKPFLKSALLTISNELHSKHPGLKVTYLDANFPFFDGFPLLPHLSHNDGKKIDLAFFYLNEGQPTNEKPARSGYGAFVEPLNAKNSQTDICRNKGYWYYDYTKYLTLGSRDDLTLNKNATKDLINISAAHRLTQKILLEPHLKRRMQITSDKIRFQGCHAVRHDDHIHLQVY